MILTVHDLKAVGKEKLKEYLDDKWMYDYCIQPSIYGEYDKINHDLKLLYHYRKLISKATKPGELCKYEHKNVVVHFEFNKENETYNPIIYIK